METTAGDTRSKMSGRVSAQDAARGLSARAIPAAPAPASRMDSKRGHNARREVGRRNVLVPMLISSSRMVVVKGDAPAGTGPSLANGPRPVNAGGGGAAARGRFGGGTLGHAAGQTSENNARRSTVARCRGASFLVGGAPGLLPWRERTRVESRRPFMRLLVTGMPSARTWS